MKDKIINFLKLNYPPFVLLFIVIGLFITNYVPNTYLTGWDNLHPEFAFGINIKRSLFAVWQEYQSLGLLGGMAHSSDLFRQLFLLLASSIIPNSILRYLWTFMTLFIGSIGAYFLINYVLKSFKHENKLIALTGSLFYLLNISTVQVFYIPFEAFIAHYAFLPWIILASLKYLQKPNPKTALITFLVFLISTPQAYIPTLFISSMLAITITSIPLFYGNFRKTSISFLKLLLIIFVANSFWLLPFIFFTINQVSVTLDSKINQMATEPIFLQNKEYGNFFNVALLKGYLFSNVEPDELGKFDYILKAWKTFFDNPFVIIGSFFVFFTIILGGIKAIKSKYMMGISFVLLFIFGFMMLATNLPPFSVINEVIRDYVPLFNQAFRFPYTKFLTIASLSYSVLLALGILWIIELIKKESFKKLIPYLFIAIILALSIPAFRGNLFYFKETLKIPNEYFQTFEFFNNQDPNTRIANFPQYTFWGWNFYKWGYSGSGFIWYGFNQPILDRAFDVWSTESENYYWEISQALYSKDSKHFEEVLNKYDVNYILIDKNAISPVSAKSVYTDELKEIIYKLPTITKLKDIGNIEIYSVGLKNKGDSFISTPPKLSSANSFTWSNYDQTYSELGDYSNNINVSDFYPYRSLFSGRNETDNPFSIFEDNDYYILTSDLPKKNNNINLHIPTLTNGSNSIPVNIIAKKTGNSVNIYLQLKNPEIYIKAQSETKKVWENIINKQLFQLNYDGKPIYININGIANYKIEELKNNEEKIIGKSSLTFDQDNIIVLSRNDSQTSTSVLKGSSIKDLFFQSDSFINLNGIEENSKLILKIPKSSDNYSNKIIDPVEEVKLHRAEINNCDNFRKQYFAYFIKEDEAKRLLELSSKNATPCIAFYVPSFDHDQAYLISINHQNIKDQNLHFWVLNEDGKFPVIDKYLNNDNGESMSYVILSPQEKYGKAYSFHFENISIGPNNSTNQLGKIKIDPIPYFFISNIKIEDPTMPSTNYQTPKLSVIHPNHSLYLVEAKKPNNDYALSLSQSYSPYWKAYKTNGFGLLQRSFPFLFGSGIDNHLKINNWKNGWIVETNDDTNKTENDKIIIVYLPQYLEYFGFALTSGTLIVLLYQYLRRKKHQDD